MLLLLLYKKRMHESNMPEPYFATPDGMQTIPCALPPRASTVTPDSQFYAAVTRSFTCSALQHSDLIGRAREREREKREG